MKKLSNSTEIIRFCNAILSGVLLGMSIAKVMRDHMREIAEEEGLIEKMVQSKVGSK